MKSAAQLLKAYETKTSTTPATEHIDGDSRMILILAIFDYRSGEWVHDFLVEEGHLEKQEDQNARLTQVRKLQRWRARMEEELGLPPRGRGGVTAAYRAKRRKWESINPRPTTAQLLSGWTPKRVDYEEVQQEPATKDPVASTSVGHSVTSEKTSSIRDTVVASGATKKAATDHALQTKSQAAVTAADTAVPGDTLRIDHETGLPDLFQLPVVEIPTNCKTPEAFAKAVKPLFSDRKTKLAMMHNIFAKTNHDRRHEIYLASLEKLDRSKPDAFLCHYADIEVALRADRASQSSWQSGISSGRGALRGN